MDWLLVGYRVGGRIEVGNRIINQIISYLFSQHKWPNFRKLHLY